MIKSVSASTLESIITNNSFEIRDDIVAANPDLSTDSGRFKHAVLTHFKTNDKVKKGEMMDIWTKECGIKPSSTLYPKIMSEYSATKSAGIWRLKWLPN